MTRTRTPHLRLGAVAAGLALALLSASGGIEATFQAPVAAAPVFTAAQAAAGRDAYQARCAGCHMADLGGRGEASPLAGPDFMTVWRARATRELDDYIRTSMPPGGATLGADEYLSLTAFILAVERRGSGATALAATTAVSIGSVATGPAAHLRAGAPHLPPAPTPAARPAAAAPPARPLRHAARCRASRRSPTRCCARRRRRLADGAPHLPGLEPQPARPRSRRPMSARCGSPGRGT